MAMRKLLPFLPALAALGACYAPPPPYNVPGNSPVNVAYQCEDGQTPIVRYFPDNRATIRLGPERAVDLAGQQGGDRFAGGGVTLVEGGGRIALEVDGRRTSCTRLNTR